VDKLNTIAVAAVSLLGTVLLETLIAGDTWIPWQFRPIIIREVGRGALVVLDQWK